MAWEINTNETKREWADNGGQIGGFARAGTGTVQTYIGPIYSPNGTAHWIAVANDGSLSATTTDPT